ncbi:MAG: peptide chain release factor N(5)-glutamine methyltransferase [Alphaproteobacteria bacterium]
MNPSPTLASALAGAAERLRAAGIAEPRREAVALAGAVLGISPERRVAEPDQPLSAEAAIRFDAAVARRARREPFARIVGMREFWSLDFALSPDTLVPRPDTETLVTAVLDSIADRDAPLSILDLGTGSGCILLALASELPNAHGLGIDSVADAVATAGENATRLGLQQQVQFRTGDWGRGVVGPFDIIVSNPPYIAEVARDSLEPEVREFDPPRALFAGDDGLDSFRAIVPQLSGLLAWGGLAAFECGAGQASKVSEMLDLSGLIGVDSRRDLGGHVRVVHGRRSGFNRALTSLKKTVGKDDVPV